MRDSLDFLASPRSLRRDNTTLFSEAFLYGNQGHTHFAATRTIRNIVPKGGGSTVPGLAGCVEARHTGAAVSVIIYLDCPIDTCDRSREHSLVLL